ncbi:response regulator [Azohydromonas australica]|uniref:response regulator n=1 Tax=Azohydromonas australica TaxID=364039 RepID=UPI000403C5D4|nr:response regulator [Azohydromonas australica]
MSGCDVLQALNDDAGTRDVPCIVLSGDAMPSNIAHALDTGFDDYWIKPIDGWQLLQRLAAALQGAG